MRQHFRKTFARVQPSALIRAGLLCIALVLSACVVPDYPAPSENPCTAQTPPAYPTAAPCAIVTGDPFPIDRAQEYASRNRNVPPGLPWHVGQWWRYENQTQGLTSTWTVERYLINEEENRVFWVETSTHDYGFNLVKNGTLEYDPSTLGQWNLELNDTFAEASRPILSPLSNETYEANVRILGSTHLLSFETGLGEPVSVRTAAGNFTAVPVTHRIWETNPGNATHVEAFWIPEIQNRAWYWESSLRGTGPARFELVAHGSWLAASPPASSTSPTTSAPSTSTTTTPPPTTKTAGAGTIHVSARPSNASPCQYTKVTIFVHAENDASQPVGEASVSSTWYYRTTTSYAYGTTDESGDAGLTRSISSATAGYTVRVSVTVTKGQSSGSTSTSFTPRDC